MSITGIESAQSPFSRIQASEATAPQQENRYPLSSLAAGPEANRGASLSEISPATQAALRKIAEQGGDVLTALRQNVEALQDDFLSAFGSRLADLDISAEEKITLRLDQGESLKVAGEHPARETIDAMLDKSPELSGSFREIAAQSALMRDIRSIRKAVARTGIAAYEDMGAVSASSGYQVSLKGEMSHFYFNRSG